MILKILKKVVPHFIKKMIIDLVDKNYRFKGWNLKTKNCPPWRYIGKNVNNSSQINYFQELQNEFENSIIIKNFESNQFKKNLLKKSRELMWRHYNVCLSLKYVIDKTKKNLSLCEVGVGDGLTTWFALKTFEKEKKTYDQFILYDSWQKMTKDHLDKDEYSKAGKFHDNDLEMTKKNLSQFKNIKFVKGFIFDTFKEKNNFPDTCDWLHIDLNSSKATLETLDKFEPIMGKNSIILFDDFGWPSYESTRINVEKWCLDKNGTLWPLTTGQAVYFINKI